MIFIVNGSEPVAACADIDDTIGGECIERTPIICGTADDFSQRQPAIVQHLHTTPTREAQRLQPVEPRLYWIFTLPTVPCPRSCATNP
jgi:hypothetical protein